MGLLGARAWGQPKQVRLRHISANSRRMVKGEFALGRRQEEETLVVMAMEAVAGVVAEGHRTGRRRTRDKDPLAKGPRCPLEATHR